MIWAPVIWDITIFEKNTKKSCLFSRKIYYHRHLGKIVSLVIFEAFTHVWIRRAICLFLRMSIVDRFQILHKCPNFHYVLKILSLRKFWVNLVCWYFMKYSSIFYFIGKKSISLKMELKGLQVWKHSHGVMSLLNA